MAYRIICDEHIEQQVVTYLGRDGHDAIHVETALSLSADDTDIAAYARKEGRVILTNDDDFLDANEFPEITVLYYPDNELPEYDLAVMVTELTTYYPTQADLPREVFVTEDYLS
jgi:uncharacterized protein with PIN domain